MKPRYCRISLFLLYWLLFLPVSQLRSQTPSSCSVPAILQTEYPMDIGHITLMRLYNLNSPWYDSITIPQIYQDTIWEGLAAIFNATSIPERDSVFDIYCIHQHNGLLWTSYNISVQIDTSYSWTEQWQNLQTTTGYPQLDNIVSNYGFIVTDYFPFSRIASLTTNQVINASAFCDSLEFFDGILIAQKSTGAGDGDYIYYWTDSTGKNFGFSVGLGDCPSGCTGRYTWKFNVDTNCSVTFTGADNWNPYNEPYYPVNCNITTGIEHEYYLLEQVILPNPVRGTFIASNMGFHISGIEIYNTLGEKVYQSHYSIPATHYSIDLSNQPSGIYFLKLQSGNNLFMQKIIISK